MSDVTTTPETTPQETLGQGLRRLRCASGLTQRELIARAQERGRISGLVEAGMSHWEGDRRVPMPGQLRQIFRVLAPPPQEAVALLQSITDYRYAGVVALLSETGSPEEIIQRWERWAESYPEHPARGRAWEPTLKCGGESCG